MDRPHCLGSERLASAMNFSGRSATRVLALCVAIAPLAVAESKSISEKILSASAFEVTEVAKEQIQKARLVRRESRSLSLHIAQEVRVLEPSEWQQYDDVSIEDGCTEVELQANFEGAVTEDACKNAVMQEPSATYGLYNKTSQACIACAVTSRGATLSWKYQAASGAVSFVKTIRVEKCREYRSNDQLDHDACAQVFLKNDDGDDGCLESGDDGTLPYVCCCAEERRLGCKMNPAHNSTDSAELDSEALPQISADTLLGCEQSCLDNGRCASIRYDGITKECLRLMMPVSEGSASQDDSARVEVEVEKAAIQSSAGALELRNKLCDPSLMRAHSHQPCPDKKIIHTTNTSFHCTGSDWTIAGQYCKAPVLPNGKSFWQAQTSSGVTYLRWSSKRRAWVLDDDFEDSSTIAILHGQENVPQPGEFKMNWKYGGKCDNVGDGVPVLTMTAD